MKKFFDDRFVHKMFLAPALLGTLIFIVLPVIFSFYLSFCSWDLLSDIRFVGLENYKELLTSPSFFLIIKNTFVFAVSTAVIALVIPLVLAAVLNNKIR